MLRFKIKKSRMWIPALGVVIAYGFFHNCAIAPYFNCRSIDWTQLILTFCIVLGLGGARDVALQKFYYIGEVQKSIDASNSRSLGNKIWIPAIGWCLVLGFSNNFIIASYFNIGMIEWGGLLSALSILLTISGVRDYGIYASERKAGKQASTQSTTSDGDELSV